MTIYFKVTYSDERIRCMYFRYRTLFPYKNGPMPNFIRHTLMSRIQNLGLLRASEVSEGLRSRKEEMTTTPSFLGQ